MTIEQVKFWVDVIFADYNDELNKNEIEEAKRIVNRSLDAWKKVEKRIQRYRSENTNTGDMFLAGCSDGAYHVLCMIHEELRGDTDG